VRWRSPIKFATPPLLTRGLLLFWALWFSVVLGSNAADALRALGLLSEGWRFSSGNLDLLVDAVSVYSLPRAWAGAAFTLVLALQITTAWLFWRATLDPRPLSPGAKPRVLSPFVAGLGLFCAFLVCDEALLTYRRFPNLETTHFVILCALLLSLVLILLLGERRQAA